MSSEPIDRETKILMGLMVLFAAGTAGSLMRNPPFPVLAAVGVSLMVTACLYRFLGGVDGSTFAVASFKAGGSVAVFAGALWFLNDRFEEQLQPVVDPDPATWIAIDSNGSPVPVRIGKNTISSEASEFLRNADWEVKRVSDGIRAMTEGGTHDLAGISVSNLLDKIDVAVKAGQGGVLRFAQDKEEGTEEDLAPYPYTLRVDGFGDERNHFSILNTDDRSVVKTFSLTKRSLDVVEHEGKNFVVFVLFATHNDPEIPSRASFGFLQLDVTPGLQEAPSP